MSRTPHPARRARQVVALVSGVSYLGVTSSIAVATALANHAEEVAADVPASNPDDAELALQLDGPATPVATSAPTVDTDGWAAGLVASTTMPLLDGSTTSEPEATSVPETAPSATSPPSTGVASPTTRPATTAAPTTAPATPAPTTAPPSSATTQGPTSSVEGTTTTTTAATTTTTAATTTTTAATTSTTEAATTTTSEPS